MQYDGSINIDTKVNTDGINKGGKSITNSLKGVLSSVMMVAKAMAAAFIGGSIINGIRSLIGQFDLMGSSIGASVKSLSTAFDALKGAFANLILAALAPLIPYVITFVQWLTQLFNIVTQIIGALFGVKAGFGGVASAAGGAGKATKKAAKEAQGALAAFDQINVLQTKKEEPDAGGGGGGGGLSLPPVDPISPEMLAKLEEFKAKAAEFFRPLTEALGRLYEALKPLGQTIWEGLKWAWDNILVPLGTWVVTDLLPAFLDLLSAALGVLNEVLIALGPLWLEFYEGFLKPIAEWTGGAIIEILDWLAIKLGELATWIKENPEKFRAFIEIVGILAASFLTILGVFTLVNSVVGFLTGAIATVSAVMAALASPVILIVVVLGLLIATILYVIAHWEQLSTTVQQIGFIIGFYVTEMGEKIKTAFNTALDAVKSKFESIFTGIQNFVRGAINNIIGFINTMIQGVVNGINGLVGSFNTVGSLVPGFSAVASVSAPQIPRLATGAVVPPNSEFLAMLGDNKSQNEIIGPEDMFRRIVREESGGNNGGNQNITITFGGTMGELVRMMKPHIDQENRRVGPSFIQSSGVS